MRKKTFSDFKKKLEHRPKTFPSLAAEPNKRSTNTQLQKEREQKADHSKRRHWNGAICVDEAENWLQKVARLTHPTPDK